MAVNDDRSGFALITVVLLMIGLAMLAAGLAFSAAQQATITRSVHDVIQARLGADAAVVLALREWDAAARSLDPMQARVDLFGPRPLGAGVTVSATSERIGPELFVVAGQGRTDRAGLPAIEHSSGRMVRSRDLAALVGLIDAGVISGSLRMDGGSEVRAAGERVDPVQGAAAQLCAAWPAGGAAVRAPADSVVIAAGAVVIGTPALADDPGALVRVVDALQPAPTGTSVADSVVHGGAGGRIVFIEGDLLLEEDASMRGLVVVLGTATVRGARIEGSLVATRALLEGGVVTIDRCAVAEALVAAEVLRRPQLPARSWIPRFDAW